MTTTDGPFGPLDRLLERAETLAGAWGARARASTTVGQERAMLRLFGVSGLDRSGRPLAGAAVDRWLSSAHDGLGGGLATADIALVGVSRTSKTPLSIYLGYLGWKATNVPLVKGIEPPKQLFEIDAAHVAASAAANVPSAAASISSSAERV